MGSILLFYEDMSISGRHRVNANPNLNPSTELGLTLTITLLTLV